MLISKVKSYITDDLVKTSHLYNGRGILSVLRKLHIVACTRF